MVPALCAAPPRARQRLRKLRKKLDFVVLIDAIFFSQFQVRRTQFENVEVILCRGLVRVGMRRDERSAFHV